MSEQKTRQLEVKTGIKASAEQVWRAVSEGEELQRWFAPVAKVEPGQGGSVFISWGAGMEFTSRITIWEPNRHLRTEGEPRSKGDSKEMCSLAVDYFIEAGDGETVLRVVTSGFGAGAEWDGEYDGTENGWRAFLKVLKCAIERHPGKVAAQTSFTVKTLLTRDECWGRIAAALGFAGLKAGDRLTLHGVTGAVENAATHEFVMTAESLDDGYVWLTMIPGAAWANVITFEFDQAKLDAFVAELKAAIAAALG